MSDILFIIGILMVSGIYFFVEYYFLKESRNSHIQAWFVLAAIAGIATACFNTKNYFESHVGCVFFTVQLLACLMMFKNKWAYYLILLTLLAQLPFIENSSFVYKSQNLIGVFIYFDANPRFDINFGSYFNLNTHQTSLIGNDLRDGINLFSFVWIYLIIKNKKVIL